MSGCKSTFNMTQGVCHRGPKPISPWETTCPPFLPLVFLTEREREAQTCGQEQPNRGAKEEPVLPDGLVTGLSWAQAV